MNKNYFTPKIELNWEVGHHKDKNRLPENWYPATVPGAVQTDLVPTLENPDWQFADGYKQFLWMEDLFWTYKTTFEKPDLQGSKQLFFISYGIDYQFIIKLNNQVIHEQEGMFSRVELNLTPYLEPGNDLLVIIYPVPKSNHDKRDKNQANRSFKPAVSYGWDWHPRLVPSGIWDETFLEIRNPEYFEEVQFDYRLDENLKDVELQIHGKSSKDTGKIRISIAFDNEPVYGETFPVAGDGFAHNIRLSGINLWWPHDYGITNLYDFKLDLMNERDEIRDQKTWKTGFRKIRLADNEGAQVPGEIFPKTRNNPPFTIEINNVSIFARGTNWVNPDIFPGAITIYRYTALLEQAKRMNFNMLRVWGGGIINKECFYELCDEMGIMVWQEFPLACNDYPDDQAYLDILKKEAISIVRRLHNHPCLALWSGGNELFNSWSGMNDQSLVIRWLNAICLIYSPEIPFIPTSPVMGVAHGHYLFYDDRADEDVFQLMNRSAATAYTEFGMPSLSDMDIIRTIIPEKELFPPSPTSAWLAHHAFYAWMGNTWLCPEIINKYFGEAESLEQLVEWSQLLQSIGYQAIYEHARQQWPHCSMALNWCFNEPWPTAANNSIIQYRDKPKPCFTAIQQACRPVLASARIPRFLWSNDEDLQLDLIMINGTLEPIPAGTLECRIKGDLAEKWDYPEIPANRNLAGPDVNYPLAGTTGKWIKIELKDPEHPDYNSEYLLMFK
jgi:beta-mannosidase